jgi:hypothetical protein
MSSTDPLADAIAMFRDLKFDFDSDKPSDAEGCSFLDATDDILPAAVLFQSDDDFDIVTSEEIPGHNQEDVHQSIDEAARRVTQFYLNCGL